MAQCVNNVGPHTLNRLLVVGVAVALLHLTAFGQATMNTKTLNARFKKGALVSLNDARGRILVSPPEKAHAATLYHDLGVFEAAKSTIKTPRDGRGVIVEHLIRFGHMKPVGFTAAYSSDRATGALAICHAARTRAPGLWGVGWSIERIPLSMNILVPGWSGLKLSAETAGKHEEFDYPHFWEAQMVLVEGDGYGFVVWAEDPDHQFKRLIVERDPDGWRLAFIGMPYAPFDKCTEWSPAPWHVQTYEGDWRVGARIYRDWATRTFNPIPVQEQTPAWIGDIRATATVGLNTDVLEPLAQWFIPEQTLLYVPNWRAQGYDHDYPDYDQFYPEFDGFVQKAKALGFRIMLHVNYFGIEPDHPLYDQFEPYHVRAPFGNHEKQYWEWDKIAEPTKFAYINPASMLWRDELVARLKTLCETYPIDALHLDQTLLIENDYNGLIDGMSMAQGNIALHKALREALPNVALSGEGLNEVTYRHEAFAQRHVYGVDLVNSTWDRSRLEMSHPISSYLLRDYTTMYGYLGQPSPQVGQYYMAYQEAYAANGVIPTYSHPSTAALKEPTGFVKQLLDETRWWLDNHVDIDMEAPWPPSVAFPYKTSDGRSVVRTVDGVLSVEGTTISRTITKVSEIALPGSIPQWPAYTADKLIGLDENRWYPWSATPRDLGRTHINALPPKTVVDALAVHDKLLFVKTLPSSTSTLDILPLMRQARCGYRTGDGGTGETTEELTDVNGALCKAYSAHLQMHPPYKGCVSGPTYARIPFTMPDNAGRFTAQLSQWYDNHDGDGVVCTARLTDGDETVSNSTFVLGTMPVNLGLDVAAFAGRDVTLELIVHPGEALNPAYDNVRWEMPRIVPRSHIPGKLHIATLGQWTYAVHGNSVEMWSEENHEGVLNTSTPGTAYLLKAWPPAVTLPVDIAHQPYCATYLYGNAVVDTTDTGHHAKSGDVPLSGGEPVYGILAHPPFDGQLQLDIPLQLPDTPAEFNATVGLQDGSRSTGVIFILSVNGVEVKRQFVLPDELHEFNVDLTPWQGKPLILTLTTDSFGRFDYDWALWGMPVVRASK